MINELNKLIDIINNPLFELLNELLGKIEGFKSNKTNETFTRQNVLLNQFNFNNSGENFAKQSKILSQSAMSDLSGLKQDALWSLPSLFVKTNVLNTDARNNFSADAFHNFMPEEFFEQDNANKSFGLNFVWQYLSNSMPVPAQTGAALNDIFDFVSKNNAAASNFENKTNLMPENIKPFLQFGSGISSFSENPDIQGGIKKQTSVNLPLFEDKNVNFLESGFNAKKYIYEIENSNKIQSNRINNTINFANKPSNQEISTGAIQVALNNQSEDLFKELSLALKQANNNRSLYKGY